MFIRSGQGLLQNGFSSNLGLFLRQEPVDAVLVPDEAEKEDDVLAEVGLRRFGDVRRCDYERPGVDKNNLYFFSQYVCIRLASAQAVWLNIFLKGKSDGLHLRDGPEFRTHYR